MSGLKRRHGVTRAAVIELDAAGYSQSDIAHRLDISQTMVSRHLIATGKRLYKPRTPAPLARVKFMLAQGATVEQIGAAMRGGA